MFYLVISVLISNNVFVFSFLCRIIYFLPILFSLANFLVFFLLLNTILVSVFSISRTILLISAFYQFALLRLLLLLSHVLPSHVWSLCIYFLIPDVGFLLSHFQPTFFSSICSTPWSSSTFLSCILYLIFRKSNSLNRVVFGVAFGSSSILRYISK